MGRAGRQEKLRLRPQEKCFFLDFLYGTYQASGIEWVTLARFAVLILRPVNTGRWAHSAGGAGWPAFFHLSETSGEAIRLKGDRKPFASTLKGEKR